MKTNTAFALCTGLICLSLSSPICAIDAQSLFQSSDIYTHKVIPSVGQTEGADSVAMPKNVQQLSKFARKFGFLPPLTWKLAFHEIQGDMFMAEFIPADERLNDWSGLVCMQGFKGMANDISPERFLDSMADRYQEFCEGDVVYEKLGSSKVDGLEAVHGLLGCSRMPNIHHASIVVERNFTSPLKGEMGYFTVVSGSDDLYLIHKSLRGEIFSSETPPLTKDNYRQFMAQE
ncbi:hypothetical protein [Shewanella maritima]|uniref:hypothetical protein n=1 Tax=Shewanella maritima TaxID=2520507 RepID=UPI00373616A8